MVRLEDRLHEESFGCLGRSRFNASTSRTTLRPGLTLDMDDEFDGLSDLRFDIRKCRLGVGAHDQIGEAGEGSCRPN